jgi:hypothetical protein
MSLSEKEIQDSLIEIANLEARIRADIATYNRLAGQADTEQRLALLSASSSRNDSDDEEHKNMTHNQYVEEVESYDGTPYASITAPNAYHWFPSSVNC